MNQTLPEDTPRKNEGIPLFCNCEERKRTRPEIAVLIPCYNEEVAIGDVVRDFRAVLPDAHIYVFDNNSHDKTIEVAERAGAGGDQATGMSRPCHGTSLIPVVPGRLCPAIRPELPATTSLHTAAGGRQTRSSQKTS